MQIENLKSQIRKTSFAIQRGSEVKRYSHFFRGKMRWIIRDYEGHKKIQKKFTSRAKADLYAQERHALHRNGHIAKSQTTDEECRQLQFWKREVIAFGEPMREISEAVRAWRIHKEQQSKLVGPGGPRVPDLVAKFLAAQAERGLGEYHQRDLKARLERFAGDFSLPLCEVGSEAIALWLRGLKVGPRTSNNYLAALKAFTAWCRKARLLPSDWTGDELGKRKLPYKAPEIYTPEELRQLLLAANPNLARCIALSAFASLRTEEVSRAIGQSKRAIAWQDFKWDQRLIIVTKEIAKTRAHNPPILDALLPWLGTIQENGRFSPYKKAKVFSGMMVALHKRLGIRPRRNGLRKSYISYRLAIVQNEAQVADEAGTSLTDLNRNYLNRPTLQEAQKYFGLRPTFVPQNVTQLALAAI